MTDPIADMLNRIRNAISVQHQTVSLPYSELKYQIAEILEKEKRIEKAEKKGRKNKKFIDIILKYDKITEEGSGAGKIRSVISSLKRISKPGQRIYSSAKDLKQIRVGMGFSIVSTPKGLMTNKEARKQKLGGEVICEVW
jgi:small subunit ribosomal protein S8